jgi:hypothetical protein
VKYIIEFNTASPLRDDAGEAVHKALVSVLGNIGNFRIVRDGATFIGYFKGTDQPIMWIEVGREKSDLI